MKDDVVLYRMDKTATPTISNTGTPYYPCKEINLTELAEKLRQEIRRAPGVHGDRSYYWKDIQCAGIGAFLLAIKEAAK